jgi:hypothetical protein
MSNPEWMSDVSLKDIEYSKLEFIQKLVFELYNLSEKERLPFLLALAGRARKENISFNPEEVELIITVVKKYSTPEEVKKMDQVLKMFQSRTSAAEVK